VDHGVDQSETDGNLTGHVPHADRKGAIEGPWQGECGDDLFGRLGVRADGVVPELVGILTRG
jgi:hypothetical protein